MRFAVLAPEGARGVPILGRAIRRGLVIGIAALLVLSTAALVVGRTLATRVVEAARVHGVIGGVPAQTERGITAYDGGDIATAERELKQAAQRYPHSSLAPRYLARIRESAGDFERSGEYLRDAVTRQPNDTTSQRMLGELYLTRAVRLRTRSPSSADERVMLDSAEAHLARAVALDATDRRARGYRGCVLGMMGRADEARDALAAASDGPWEDCTQPPSL